MKAILVQRHGEAEVLEYTTVDDPEPGPGQVLIRVHTVGVNFADIKQRRGGYRIKRSLPFIPGLDASGTIVAVGAQVQHLQPGQRVVAFPMAGSYCELVVAKAILTFPIPDDISDETAAAFPVVAGTTYAMLKKIAGLQPQESILIHSAAGAVGTTALQMARHLGARPIFATVGNDAKKALPVDLGADPVFNYRSEDYVKGVLSRTDGRGVDVIMNPLAGDILERDLGCLADFGRLVCYGNAGGRAAKIQSDQLHGSCRSVLGFSFGNMRRNRPEAVADIMQSVISLISEGRIRMLIGKRFALRDAAKAHQFLESRTSTGKILLTLND